MMFPKLRRGELWLISTGAKNNRLRRNRIQPSERVHQATGGAPSGKKKMVVVEIPAFPMFRCVHRVVIGEGRTRAKTNVYSDILWSSFGRRCGRIRDVCRLFLLCLDRRFCSVLKVPQLWCKRNNLPGPCQRGRGVGDSRGTGTGC